MSKIEDKVSQSNLEDTYRAFFDLSSTCTGYVVAKMEGRKCTISRAGVMWFGDNWEHGRKYFQLQSFITDQLYVVNAITDVIYEQYNIDPKNVGNCLVVPEMIGALKACLYDIASMPLGCESIPPTAWRKKLGVTSDKTLAVDKFGHQILTSSGKLKYTNDWKSPVIRYMNDLFPGLIPQKLVSNVTGKTRAVPNDLYDALGVCIGWHKKFGCNEFVIDAGAFDGVPEDVI